MKTPAQMIANVLPADARDALVQAAQSAIPGNDGRWRQRAIEQVIQRIKLQYPQFFRHRADF